MRIISWNVRFDNRKAIDLISQAISLNPDVLCLQEVRGDLVPLIRTTFPKYYVYGCLEVSHLDPLKQNFLCTITKMRADQVSVINYDQAQIQTVWEKFFFVKMHNWKSRHAALVITVPLNVGKFRIVNLHLPASSNSLIRMNDFKLVVSKLPDLRIPTVFCGDFNIVDNYLFKITSGWLLGFTKSDYKTSERNTFDSLFSQIGFSNIFKKMSTYVLPWHGMQLDHILVPEYIPVTNKIVGNKRFASDHRMILADLAI